MYAPMMAMAAPMIFNGRTGVRNIIIDDTMTDIRFIVLPILNESAEISSNDIYENWLYKW